MKRHWIIRHPFKALLLLILGTPFLLGMLNYGGMCIPKGRWLSDEEKIRKVVEVMVENSKPHQTVDEFLRNNPDCCSVGMHLSGDYFPPAFMDKLLGNYEDKVEVKFVANNEKRQSQFVIGNCGNIWGR